MDQDSSSNHPEELRSAMRRWASGVTVVTSIDGTSRHGMTVSSFSSVSLAPPTILVSLQHATRTHEFVKQSGVFGVTILDDSQKMLSERFAGRNDDLNPDRFYGLETFSLETGAPLIEGGLAWFDCRVIDAIDVGDHTVFIGEIQAVRADLEGQPLIYYNRDYRHLYR